MTQWPPYSARRVSYVLAGGLLGLGAPAGWWLIDSLFDVGAPTLYVYLTLSTTTVFALFGYVAGGLIERTLDLAEHDSLTGLLNQGTFFRIAEAQFELGRRREDEAALIMIDLDHFKAVNDNHNHLFGSLVIAEVGKLLARLCRKADVVARFGGDEYIIFLPCTDYEGAVSLARRLHEEIRTTKFEKAPHALYISASIGVAHLRCSEAANFTALVELADEMVYESKRKGRDSVSSRSTASSADALAPSS